MTTALSVIAFTVGVALIAAAGFLVSVPLGLLTSGLLLVACSVLLVADAGGADATPEEV